MRNIKIEIEYDGTDFYGWQFQPELRTIQGDIENALKVIFRNEITVIGAGRTDTGVHARGQVANFLIEHTMPVLTVKAALNGNLSKDVRIISAIEVSQSFHARYDAIKRHYSYTITKQEKAIDRHYMWCYKSTLDIEQMQQASHFLLGEHDFSAFCQADENMKHYRCFMEEIRWEQNGALLILNIIANRFLHNMVRIIVGTMINVGRGFAKVADIPQILESRDRRNAGPTIPAKGLCLEKVYYGDETETELEVVMKFFIDTANIEEIKEAAKLGILDGVTTNPTLISKVPGKFENILKSICEIVTGPVSAEVVSLNAEGMIKEGRELAKIHKNIVIKIPIIKEGLKAIKQLESEGIHVNVTLIFSATQALLAAKAGASYVSPFVGRIDDISYWGMDLVRDMAIIFKNYDFKTEIIVASIRNPLHVVEAALAGAHIATIPFHVIEQLVKHPLTDLGIERFLADWEQVKSR